MAFVVIRESGFAPARLGALTGRVVTAATGDSVGQATLLLRPRTKAEIAAQAVGDLTGRFELDSLTPGMYLLETRRLGYEVRRDAIELPAGERLQVVVPLRPAILDGCPGFMAVRSRRPRWRWW